MKQQQIALILLALVLTPVVGTVVAAADRPNILLIAVDDMGYSDVGPFGSEIKAPSINSLAKTGVRFTNFYVGPSCSPTRSMLFSGNDNHVAGLGNMSVMNPIRILPSVVSRGFILCSMAGPVTSTTSG